ncbi:MAG: DsrE/DsrF/DrsH-like family protein [Gammaproteobacteria bacterium]|nr:DsrE/DsrF/DrsH-like family protein [Gammaproteobacteria bacterium]MCP5299439.1 DsrE/DsrF/DrsH-like family protein [Chromatiaceae bacterium]
MSNATNIICLSGSREKLQMAAMVASVSVACGDQVTVFFSMNALEYFVKGRDHAAPIEGEFGKLLDKKGVPAFKTLFQQAVDLGDAKLLPCSMAMDLLEITAEDLDDELGPATGLTKFLNDAEGGRIVSF